MQVEGATLLKGHRAARATGAAIAAAAALLEATVPGTGARIMVLTGGPATVGPGRVVGSDQAEPLRTHKVCDAACDISGRIRLEGPVGSAAARHTECWRQRLSKSFASWACMLRVCVG